jgi:hypothetical protein
MMFKFIGVAIIVLVAGCSYPVKRHGYTYDYDKAERKYDVHFEKGAEVDSSIDRVIGTVSVNDNGLHNMCNKSDVLHVLQTEARAAGANIVNILEERMPDSSNYCYRVDAMLIKRKSAALKARLALSGKKPGDVDTATDLSTVKSKKDAEKTDSVYTAEAKKNRGGRAALAVIGLVIGLSGLLTLFFIPK